MSEWTKLSFEVLTAIFSHLVPENKETILACQLVCTNWNSPAQYLLYEDVELTAHSQFVSLVKTLNANERLPSLVKRLILIEQGSSTPQYQILSDLQEYIPQVLQRCLNLKIINMRCVPRNPLFQAISNHQSEDLRLTHITSPSFDNDEESLEYGEAAWKLRESLQSLMISDNVELPYISFNHNKMSALDKFSQLDEVRFWIPQDLTSLQKAFSSIQNCKTIRTVNIIQFDDDFDSPENIKYVKSGTCDSVRTFKGIEFVCGDSLVQYIIHTFNSLDNITLSFIFKIARTLSTLSTDQLIVATRTGIEFLHYLNKMKQFEVEFLYVDNVSSVITECLPSMNSDCRLYMHYCYDADRISHIIKRPSDDSILLNIGIAKPAPYDLSKPLPHQHILEGVGACITYLNLNFVMVKDDEEIQSSDSSRYVLYHILEACSSLKTLILNEVSLHRTITPSPSYVFGYHRLDLLEFEDCNIDIALLSDVSTQVSNIDELKLVNTSFSGPYQNTWRIDMVHTSFKQITITHGNSSENRTGALIKITFKENDRALLFHVVDGKIIGVKKADCDLVNFIGFPAEEMVGSDPVLLIHINCTTLQRLVILQTRFSSIIIDYIEKYFDE